MVNNVISQKINIRGKLETVGVLLCGYCFDILYYKD